MRSKLRYGCFFLEFKCQQCLCFCQGALQSQLDGQRVLGWQVFHCNTQICLLLVQSCSRCSSVCELCSVDCWQPQVVCCLALLSLLCLQFKHTRWMGRGAALLCMPCLLYCAAFSLSHGSRMLVSAELVCMQFQHTQQAPRWLAITYCAWCDVLLSL